MANLADLKEGMRVRISNPTNTHSYLKDQEMSIRKITPAGNILLARDGEELLLNFRFKAKELEPA